MKRFNLLSLSCLFVLSLLAGCSDSTAPATGGAMMNDTGMMKGDMKDDGMMKGDMKSDGMMKEDGMIKEESK